MKKLQNYSLDSQIGFLLRKANQRHTGIFLSRISKELTPTRFAAMAKLHEKGALSQNELGRLTAMDVSTIKGVVDRLLIRELVTSQPDPNDARRRLIKLTTKGTKLIKESFEVALQITIETLKPLDKQESELLLGLLKKIS